MMPVTVFVFFCGGALYSDASVLVVLIFSLAELSCVMVESMNFGLC